VSSLNVAVVLTLITGLGGAVAGGYVFNAPWWTLPLLGVAGLIIGLGGAIVQNQLRIRLTQKDEEGKGAASFLSMVANLVLPFVSVILVTAVTVIGSVFLTKTIWPEEAANPRSLGPLESSL